ELIADAARSQRTLVVLDEFQYLVKQSPELGSILSRWWREVGRDLDLVLVLAGSDVAFFADEVLGANAPLHGRKTADHRLEPFDVRHAALFLGGWSIEDQIRAYGLWGGTPYYLDFIDPGQSIEQNLVTTVFQPGAPLANEAEYLIPMVSRLRDVAMYGSILRAVASGKTTLSEVTNHLGPGVDSAGVSRSVDRLESIGLVRRVRPIVKARARDTRFEIADPFLRFWYAFVATAGARTATTESAERYVRRQVMPRLDEFVWAPTFEHVCQRHLQRFSDAAAVGHWWGPVHETLSTGVRSVQREVDGVAIDDDGEVTAVATCKWTSSPVGLDEIRLMRRLASHIQPERSVPIHVYSRSGVDPAVIAHATRDQVVVHDLERLFD
ncbi:MAG: ATP-binding protein, partial [Thermoleophilia bacterium]|nr:ATP-binding protein [Thermoleophilia bacterium]